GGLRARSRTAPAYPREGIMKRITRVCRHILFGIVSTSVAAGCVDLGETPESGAPSASERTVPAAGTVDAIKEPLDGQNGVLTVASADQIINQYAVLAADVTAGATSITVTDIGDFKAASSLFASGLAAGDLIMIYQPQGATIEAPDDESYGNVQ